MTAQRIELSVIVPAFQNPQDLQHCLEGLKRSTSQPKEVLVVDDASHEHADAISTLCEKYEVTLIRLERHGGPAAARNAGARAATGDILLFVDADVVVHPDTLQRVVEFFATHSDVHAVFGSYDNRPTSPQAVSQFRNLLHHYVHHQSAGPATTFWGACGAVRREAFQHVRGFDETYRQPSIEDVEMGGRLHAAGYRIELDPAIQVTHRKRWTLTSLFYTDLLQRAAPWTEAALKACGLPRGLNFGWYNRASVGLIGLALAALALRMPSASLALVATVLALNWPVYRFMIHTRGIEVLPASMVAHLCHYLAAFLGSVLGALRFLRRRDPWAAPALGIFLTAAAWLQIVAGAYTADFSPDSDEPSHFVTSTMFSQFYDAPFQNPVAFAYRYYVQFPKVGIGHWPPLGYFIQGAWIHGFGTSRAAIMILLLLWAVVAAYLFYELLWQDAGRLLATTAAVAWLANATVQEGYQQFMMDVPGITLCLLAVLLFRAYVTRPSLAASLSFGTIAAAAILLKQTSVALAIVPAVYVLLTRRWSLLRRTDFWMAVIPSLLLAAPWYLFSTVVFYKDVVGWSGLAGHGGAATHFKWSIWWRIGGIPITLLSAVGLIYTLLRMNAARALWATILVSMVVVSGLLQAMNEPRHILLGLAAQIAMAAVALTLVPANFRVPAALALIAFSWCWQTTPHYGYTSAAGRLNAGPDGHVLLYGHGDGSIVATAAAYHPDANGRRDWLRANKLLGEVKWSGKIDRLYVHTNGEVSALLAHVGINQVYLEDSRTQPEAAIGAMLRSALEQAPQDWSVTDVPLAEGAAKVFRRRTPIPPRSITFYLPRLGHDVGRSVAR